MSEITQCEVCKSGIDLEVRCANCEQCMCSSCRITHDSFKGCQRHILVKMKDVIDNPADERLWDFCPKHKDREAEYHCNDCLISMCYRCFIKDHNGHGFLDLQDECTQISTRQKLKTLNHDLEAQIGKFSTYSECLTSTLKDINSSAEKACRDVDNQVEIICNTVKQHGQNMKVEIQKSRDEEITKLTKPLDEIKTLIENLKANIKYTEDILEEKSIVHVIDRLYVVQKEKDEVGLRNLDIPNVNLSNFNEGVIDNTIIKQLGRFECLEQATFTCSFNIYDEILQSGKSLSGDHVIIQGLPWCITVAKEEKEIGSTLDVYIDLNSYLTKDKYGHSIRIASCKIKCDLKLINFKDKSQSIKMIDNPGRPPYTPDLPGNWGQTFIKWEDLANKDNGFLDDENSFLIEMTLRMINLETKTKKKV